jgi:hypothetical protein
MSSVYDFKNQVRDVVPLLEFVNAESPKLISRIGAGAEATRNRHEWVEFLQGVKGVEGTAEGMVITADSAVGLAVGQQIQPEDTNDVYVIEGITGNKITVAKVREDFGNPPTEKTKYNVYGAPVATGSTTGEEAFIQGETKDNFTQIFRRDTNLTGTAISTDTYDNANQMNLQVMNAMRELQYELNFTLWHGYKAQGAKGLPAKAGGLYDFCNENVVDAGGDAITEADINTVVGKIIKKGGLPNTIVLNRALAPAISALYKDQIIIGEDSTTRGAYVNKIKDAYGNILDVIYDDQCPKKHCWIMDINKIKLSPLQGRAFKDMDSTPAGYDGEKRTVIGEYTFEIYNAAEAFGRIINIG